MEASRLKETKVRSAAAGQGRSQEEPVTPAPWDSSTPGAVPILPHVVTTEGGCEELVQGTRCVCARCALARQERGSQGWWEHWSQGWVLRGLCPRVGVTHRWQ